MIAGWAKASTEGMSAAPSGPSCPGDAMSGRLEGKTAIVTGSTKGIGLGIARAYVREGARVVINSRSAADCASVARELGSAAVAVAADLSRSDEVRRLAKESLAALDGT